MTIMNIEITQPESYKRCRISDYKIIYHSILDANGNIQKVKCIEYTIIGRNRKWTMWAYYDDFVKVNPDIAILFLKEIEE